VANGGTGATTLTANNVLLGNNTSALQVVAPGTSGNVLTSNGTTWVSSTPSGGGVTSAVAGNGVAVSASTGAVTFSVSAPSTLSIGSYSAVLSNAGSSYASLSVGSSIPTPYHTSSGGSTIMGSAISGTWIVMSGAIGGVFVCGTRQNMYIAVRSA
jgi:hypothetical protein